MLFNRLPESFIVTASKHEIVPVGIVDPSSYLPFADGAVSTIDPETGRTELLDFSSSATHMFEKFCNEKNTEFKRLGIKPLWIENRENFMDDLVNGFRKLNSVRKK